MTSSEDFFNFYDLLHKSNHLSAQAKETIYLNSSFGVQERHYPIDLLISNLQERESRLKYLDLIKKAKSTKVYKDYFITGEIDDEAEQYLKYFPVFNDTDPRPFTIPFSDTFKEYCKIVFYSEIAYFYGLYLNDYKQHHSNGGVRSINTIRIDAKKELEGIIEDSWEIIEKSKSIISRLDNPNNKSLQLNTSVDDIFTMTPSNDEEYLDEVIYQIDKENDLIEGLKQLINESEEKIEDLSMFSETDTLPERLLIARIGNSLFNNNGIDIDKHTKIIRTFCKAIFYKDPDDVPDEILDANPTAGKNKDITKNTLRQLKAKHQYTRRMETWVNILSQGKI